MLFCVVRFESCTDWASHLENLRTGFDLECSNHADVKYSIEGKRFDRSKEMPSANCRSFKGRKKEDERKEMPSQ